MRNATIKPDTSVPKKECSHETFDTTQNRFMSLTCPIDPARRRLEFAAAQSPPFAGLAGSWAGSGSISLSDGSKERLRCKATYQVSDGERRLQQSLRCASDSYRFDLNSDVASQQAPSPEHGAKPAAASAAALPGARVQRVSSRPSSMHPGSQPISRSRREATSSRSRSFHKATFEASRSRWFGAEAVPASATGGQENDHERR